MRKQLKTFVAIGLLALVVLQTAVAEPLDRDSLVRSIQLKLKYGNYTEAQELLLKNLEDPELSPEDRIFNLMFLAYTYKQVLDYPSVLRFLSEAESVAEQVDNRDSVRSVILTEKAFVYFDREQFDRADSVQQLVQLKYVDEYGQSVLLLQSGVHSSRKGELAEAEQFFLKAEELMRAASRCDMPLVHVKQMALYASMNNMAKRDTAFARAWENAVDCNIMKHQLFAVEEYLKLLKINKELERATQYQAVYDSLRVVFDAEQHAMELTRQREERLLQQKNSELQMVELNRHRLRIGILVLVCLLGVLAVAVLVYRRRQKEMDAELQMMRNELLAHMKHMEAAQYDSINEEEHIHEPLSSRQQEVLDLLLKGHSNKEIAAMLFISENTVKFHIKGIYQAMGISGRKELLAQVKKDH